MEVLLLYGEGSVIMLKAMVLAGLILAKLPFAATGVREGRTAKFGAYCYPDRGSYFRLRQPHVRRACDQRRRSLGSLTLKAKGIFAAADSHLSFTGAATLVADNGDELTGLSRVHLRRSQVKGTRRSS